jgi:hypothetical protein
MHLHNNRSTPLGRKVEPYRYEQSKAVSEPQQE